MNDTTDLPARSDQPNDNPAGAESIDRTETTPGRSPSVPGGHLDGDAQSALASLQFIVAGLIAQPDDSPDSPSTDTIDETAASLEPGPDITEAATTLVHTLLDSSVSLRDDQARGIADACSVLGVPMALTLRLSSSSGDAPSPDDS